MWKGCRVWGVGPFRRSRTAPPPAGFKFEGVYYPVYYPDSGLTDYYPVFYPFTRIQILPGFGFPSGRGDGSSFYTQSSEVVTVQEVPHRPPTRRIQG